MPYGVKILKHSINRDKDIFTFEASYPRFVHAELMTHRLFSRNAASSRAIPSEKMFKNIVDDPAVPVFWGKNQPGMQADVEIDDDKKVTAKDVWMDARHEAIKSARKLMDLGVHKQIANRITEPWMHITIILTTTELSNWFKLRCGPEAQPEIAWVANEMKKQVDKLKASGTSRHLQHGDWHMPLIDHHDILEVNKYFHSIHGRDPSFEEETAIFKKVSTGRCARVSYLTHAGTRDIIEDIKLHDRLLISGHWSPFEHVATPIDVNTRCGNFVGWKQYRKEFVEEHPEKLGEDNYNAGSITLTKEEARALNVHVRPISNQNNIFSTEHLDAYNNAIKKIKE